MQLPRLAALVLSFGVLSSGAIAQSQKTLPSPDPSLPSQQRVDDLVSRMTLEEKVPQLINTAPAIPRLNVPAYDYWSEGLHGIARSGYATLFPQAIGMAATWDAPLVNQISTVISTEARAKYNEAVRNNIHSIYYGLTIWSPNINIFRDPRWGRGQETYGEDPFLTARLGVAFVKGLQGDDPTYFKTIATPKHYAVHSGPESTRHSANIDPTPPPPPPATLPTSTPPRTTSGTPTSPPFAPPSSTPRPTPSCAPTTPSIGTPPAPVRCSSRPSSAATGVSRASSPPTAAPSTTSSKPK